MFSDRPLEVEVNLSSMTISNKSLVRAVHKKKYGIPPFVEHKRTVSSCIISCSYTILTQYFAILPPFPELKLVVAKATPFFFGFSPLSVLL